MKKFMIFAVVAVLTLSVLSGCTPYHAQGAGSGALIGGVAGAMLDHKNPWRGGVWGAALGSLFGATLSDISTRASQEVVQYNRPVRYSNRNYEYEAEPAGYNAQTKCHKVKEQVWQDGKLIKNQEREVCEGRKVEHTY